MTIPEMAALGQLRARHRVASRLDAMAQARSHGGQGHLTASPERRAERRAEKDAWRRKKAIRKRSRR